MAIEKLNIDNNEYLIHQVFPAYGIDSLGSPYCLGEDYLDVEILTPDRAVVTDKGEIAYSFTAKVFDEEDGFMYYIDVTQTEAEFIAYCSIELDDTKNPSGVLHKNGDQRDNCIENLEWEYQPQD